MQPFGQDRPDELIRAEPGECQAEREYADGVGAEAGEQFGPPPRGGKEGRVRSWPDDLVRVRVEGDHHDWQVHGPRDLPGPRYDALVAAVHAVEHADRRGALAPVGRPFSQAGPAGHHPRSLLRHQTTSLTTPSGGAPPCEHPPLTAPQPATRRTAHPNT